MASAHATINARPDLEEVDVNEKKAAGGGGSGSKRRTVGGSSPPPKDAKRKPKPKEASEEPEPEVTATTAAGRKEPPLYFMPMDSFYTKALTGAKVCLLLLHLLQVLPPHVSCRVVSCRVVSCRVVSCDVAQRRH
jgi:hypothetical protein